MDFQVPIIGPWCSKEFQAPVAEKARLGEQSVNSCCRRNSLFWKGATRSEIFSGILGQPGKFGRWILLTDI
jgi:hypothetical protein